MRLFKTFLETGSIATDEDYVKFYIKVRDAFWPEQKEKPEDYKRLLESDKFTIQRQEERLQDFVSKKTTRRQKY